MFRFALPAGRSAAAARPAFTQTVTRHGAQALQRGFELFATWQARSRARRQLMALDSHTLKDLGVGPGDAYMEYSKPFWRP